MPDAAFNASYTPRTRKFINKAFFYKMVYHTLCLGSAKSFRNCDLIGC